MSRNVTYIILLRLFRIFYIYIYLDITLIYSSESILITIALLSKGEYINLRAMISCWIGHL